MLRIALLASVALHGVLGMWVEVRGAAHERALTQPADSWSGPGIEVDALPFPAPEAPEAPAAEPANQERPASAEHAPSTPATASPDRTASKPATTPERTPRTTAPRPKATPAPSAKVATAASTQAPADGSASTNAPSAPAAAFGAAGLPAGVRHLPNAFTRALGIANRGDARWLALSPGAAGEAHLELAVDAEGKLGELVYREPGERVRLAPVVQKLLDNARLLLEHGVFSLAASTLASGVQHLRVRVEVLETAAAADGELDRDGLKSLEWEPPSGRKPGHGSFELNSGRRVVAWVYVE